MPRSCRAVLGLWLGSIWRAERIPFHKWRLWLAPEALFGNVLGQSVPCFQSCSTSQSTTKDPFPQDELKGHQTQRVDI